MSKYVAEWNKLNSSNSERKRLKWHKIMMCPIDGYRILVHITSMSKDYVMSQLNQTSTHNKIPVRFSLIISSDGQTTLGLSQCPSKIKKHTKVGNLH